MPTSTNNNQVLQLNTIPIERTSKFCYLGSIMSPNGGATEDVDARIQKAKLAFASLNKFWNSASINRQTKLQVFTTNVKSVLLYGCETWLVTESLCNKIQVFINKCLRKILGIHWPATIRNEELWSRTGQKEVRLEVQNRKWKWIGHILRREESNITKQALSWNPQGRRKVGRPRNTWRRSVHAEAHIAGKSWNEVKHLAQNRTRWRCFIEALCSS